jgi:tight adherence protein B
LPDAIDMVVRVVRAGLPVGVAIRTVGQEAEPPLSTVFVKIADQADIGRPLGQALATTSETVGNPDFRFFAVAVALQQATGGNLTATLETLSEIIRRRRAVRLKARAATAEVRISGIVLGAIPFVVAGALLMVAPTYLAPLFADPRGNIILGLALLGLLLAGITMRAMIRNSLMV